MSLNWVIRKRTQVGKYQMVKLRQGWTEVELRALERRDAASAPASDYLRYVRRLEHC